MPAQKPQVDCDRHAAKGEDCEEGVQPLKLVMRSFKREASGEALQQVSRSTCTQAPTGGRCGGCSGV